MSRDQKIGKLARAIKEYRGRYNATAKKWETPPNPGAAPRVMKWIQSLGLPLSETAHRVTQFKTIAEFNAWLKTI
jgi:hypothetical protein